MRREETESRSFNQAVWSAAAIFGILVGVAAIGPAQRFWEHGTEHMLTIVPSFLWSGVLAIIVGALIILRSVPYLKRRFGAPILFPLGAASFLVGGGFAPGFFSVLTAIAFDVEKGIAEDGGLS